MSILSIIKSKVFYKNVAYAGAAYVLFFLLITIGLRIYTHHGESFPIPDFKGLQSDRVAQIADYNDLRYVIVDSTYVSYLPKGSIIDQHPLAGVNVKKGRTVFLTINAYNQAKVEMPNVVGVSYRQGKSTLESIGLKVGKLIYKPDYAENNILKQLYNGVEIEMGQMIEKGQEIDLVLGNGLGRSTSLLPELVKIPYQRAVNAINDAFLNLGKVYYDESVQNYNDSLNALVFKQRPEYYPRGRVAMGSTIDIWLTVDKSVFETPNANDTIDVDN